VPVFSFDKFPNVDKSLGPEMKSTGEAIYFIKDLKDPFFRQVYGERASGQFDFVKLVQFLKELNVAHSTQSLLSIPMLVRAIIDHVPPIFDKSNFADVCGSHGSRSFKDSMNNLDKSSRKIADSYLHTPIRIRENLPTPVQVNFRHDLDVLLQEIVRIVK
jgi:hypothetical protein